MLGLVLGFVLGFVVARGCARGGDAPSQRSGVWWGAMRYRAAVKVTGAESGCLRWSFCLCKGERGWEIAGDEERSPEIAGDEERSPEVAGGDGRPNEIAGDRGRLRACADESSIVASCWASALGGEGTAPAVA